MSVERSSEVWLKSQPTTALIRPKGRLLIAISDSYLRTLLETVLGREGYETTSALIDAVETSAHSFHDVLVTDAESLLNIGNLAELTQSIRVLALDWANHRVASLLTGEVTVVDPLQTELLLTTVQFLCQVSRLERENRLLRRTIARYTASNRTGVGGSADTLNFNDPLNDQVDRLEKSLITSALQRTRGSQVQAAQLLGIKATTLNMKLKRHQIDVNSFRQLPIRADFSEDIETLDQFSSLRAD